MYFCTHCLYVRMGALPWTLRTSGATKTETLNVSASESSPLPKSVKTTIENHQVRRGSLDDIHNKSTKLKSTTINLESIKNNNISNNETSAIENNTTIEEEEDTNENENVSEEVPTTEVGEPAADGTTVKEEPTEIVKEEADDLDTTPLTTTTTTTTS